MNDSCKHGVRGKGQRSRVRLGTKTDDDLCHARCHVMLGDTEGVRSWGEGAMETEAPTRPTQKGVMLGKPPSSLRHHIRGGEGGGYP